MKIQRAWAMPSANTFTIKPIKELIEKYIKCGMVVIDPFANSSKYGTITNDLNPEFKTTYCMDALKFLKKMKTKSADLILFDPPYSFTQAKSCYDGFGKEKLEINVSNKSYWSNCKNEVARVLKLGGICICFGWNSCGIGKKRGFDILEILLVSHGGGCNDTIATVEENRNLF